MPLRQKKFILPMQPHEAVSPTHADRSPWSKTLAFGVLLLLMGLAFSNTLEDHLSATRRGLERVALGTQICPLMPPQDAIMLLKEWYGATEICSEANEAKWQAYCQQFYVSEGGDCSTVTPANKAMIMDNMKVCRKI
jgi:hypothetical protein